MAPERPADANLRLDRKRDDCKTDPKCCTIPESSFQALQHIKNCASCVWGCPHHRYIGRNHTDTGSLVLTPTAQHHCTVRMLVDHVGLRVSSYRTVRMFGPCVTPGSLLRWRACVLVPYRPYVSDHVTARQGLCFNVGTPLEHPALTPLSAHC
jgi:hypothetical protein